MNKILEESDNLQIIDNYIESLLLDINNSEKIAKVRNEIVDKCEALKKELLRDLKIDFPPTFKEWMKANYDTSDLEGISKDVTGGFHGLIYYSETHRLYNYYEDEISQAVDEEECHSNFKTNSDFKNDLVWWMAEKTAQEILDENTV